MDKLLTNISKINRVGETTAKRLKILGIETIYDLLYFFPFRYEDYSEITPISKLRPNTTTNVIGTVELIQNRRSARKRMKITEALITDGTEQLKVIWFNQPFIAKNISTGDKISLAGKIDSDYGGVIMKSPAYEKIYTEQNVNTQGIVPVYHSTANITQKQIRFLVKQAIIYARDLEDWLPGKVIKRQKLTSLRQAIKQIHFPLDFKEVNEAKRRLAFNEMFLTQLQSQYLKNNLKSQKAKSIKFKETATKKFVDSLPFQLTNAQKKSAWEILLDIEKEKPMTRLLEGDVGSGKTVVAVLSLYNTVLNKKQAVLMVPTEILAKQHFQSICKMLDKYKIRIGLLTRSDKKINEHVNFDKKISNKKNNLSKNQIAELIKNSEIDIVIGTHALIQEKIKFKNLEFVIIDEQHRFGVEQRKAIIEKSGDKNTTPHLLSMTATPIPRSLALILYGELDISIIDEMPKGRKKIITRVVSEHNREQAYNFIRSEIKNGRQIFVICPLIDVSDKLGVKSVKEEFKKLDEIIFPDISIAMLHGKLKSTEKEQIMQDFLDKKTKILVSTSVIEVGIDVPNSTIMMIEGADRFGLAQLHQFRGRVGRGEHQSYCFLFSDNESDKTAERLYSLEKHHDGFSLAKIDLKFRGPGEVYGTSQKGFPEFNMANIFDQLLIKQTHEEAKILIEEDPKLKKWPKLDQKLNAWEKNLHLE